MGFETDIKCCICDMDFLFSSDFESEIFSQIVTETAHYLQNLMPEPRMSHNEYEWNRFKQKIYCKVVFQR